SRRRHTRFSRDWSSDVCSSDLGFADLAGFGRREIQVSPKEVYALMVYQIGAISTCANVQGTVLHHVKPHGALYNMAAKDTALAEIGRASCREKGRGRVSWWICK